MMANLAFENSEKSQTSFVSESDRVETTIVVDMQKPVGKSENHLCSWLTAPCSNHWGIIFSLISALASSVAGIIVKYMENVHPFSLAAYRYQGIFLPALSICLVERFVRKKRVMSSIWPINERENLIGFTLIMIRVLIGCVDLFLYFYAIKLISIADVKVICSCRVIFVAIVAHIFIRERCGCFQGVTSLIAIIGVAVISRPPILTGDRSFSSDELLGAGFATLSMLSEAVCNVVLRYLRKAHAAMLTAIYGLGGTVISLCCSAFVQRFDVPETLNEWILIFCLAGATFFTHIGLILALKYEPAAAVVAVNTCDIIFTFLFQFWILGQVPDVSSFIGATLIGGCVFLISFRNWVCELPEAHSARKMFWFVLV